MGFLEDHIVEVLFAVITAGVIGFFKYLNSRIKEYQRIIEERDDVHLKALIQDEIDPIIRDLSLLDQQVAEIKETHSEQLNVIVHSYRYRLIQLCKSYLKQGYMTQEQYDQLSEFYAVYHDLGGNGQAQDYFEKTTSLPVHEDFSQNK